MPSITLKDIPAPIHGELKKRAATNRRSLNKEVIACLETVLKVTPVDSRAMLNEFRAHRITLPGKLDDALLQTAKSTGRP